MTSFKKYKTQVHTLINLKQSGSIVASRHFCQLGKAIQEYYSSSEHSSLKKTFLDFPQVQIKLSEIELYLSSFSKAELKNLPQRLTFQQQPEYPPLNPEDYFPG